MPLAIELAAARVRVLGLQRLAERLHGALRLLRSSHGDDRHRTLRAVVAWSYDRLEPDLQELLWRSGVFAGGFTLETAEAVLTSDKMDGCACRLGLTHEWHEETATILLSLSEFTLARIFAEVFVLMAELAEQFPAGISRSSR